MAVEAIVIFIIALSKHKMRVFSVLKTDHELEDCVIVDMLCVVCFIHRANRRFMNTFSDFICF